MNPLVTRLIQRIRAGGPITFAQYMRAALYDPEDGYYTSGAARTGWGGDFVTSPEIDPAFGALWARGLEELWVACGCPGRFDVVEIGSGEGGFTRALTDAAEGRFARALHLTLIELSASRRVRQQARLRGAPVEWLGDLDDASPFGAGCVFANEVLDNQPVHVLRRDDGGVAELHVGVDGDGLVEMWLPCADPELTGRVPTSTHAPDARVEVSPAVEELVCKGARLVGRGAAIFVDYGRASPGQSDTLVAYSAGGVDARGLDDPGSRDITAHVDWHSVRHACAREGLAGAGPVAQRDVLLALGAGALDEDLRAAHERALEGGRGAEAVRLLSRRQALRALLDPGGLGGLDVFAGIAALEPPSFLKQKDRP